MASTEISPQAGGVVAGSRSPSSAPQNHFADVLTEHLIRAIGRKYLNTSLLFRYHSFEQGVHYFRYYHQ